MSLKMERKGSEMFVDERRFATDRRPWFGQLPERIGKNFTFAVMGDRCGMALPGVFEKGLAILQDLKPDFVLFVGDLVEGYGMDSEEARNEWEYIDAQIAATGLPFFQTIGNHDFGTQTLVDVWRERKGIEYYAFRVGDVLFLILNTEDPFEELSDELIARVKLAAANIRRDPERASEYVKAFDDEVVASMSPDQLQDVGKARVGLGDEQLAFFENVLASNADAKYTFVSMHKPGWKSDSSSFARLREMIGSRPHTIFAGHFHSLEYSRTNEACQIQLGRTGAASHGEGKGDQNLLLWVSMRSGVPSIRVVHLDGITEPADYPPRHP
ncbi:metallophosphoesterase family protein [Cohnella zeiphila]|uniref:Metallophosphoesterase n=1 Tax=Cohnella zeiphila TaxID=2761120 RepID=A0A7X0SIU3_9BACL|nr:metallophosphoesterase [Cohnella zeiphila]MBB6730757.1 metallophosphoesterase [Cohnella zeiphila]